MNRMCCMLLIAASTFIGACASTSGPPEDPYALFRELMPRSILILPPINESVDLNASYSWLTTASRPVAEKGFYVFPVAVIDEFMKENGLPNPEDMHAAPLNKFGEIFGADAVMYVTIEEFGQKFELLQSVTRVTTRAELLDVKTGRVIWSDRLAYADTNTNNSSGGLLGALVTAAVAQVSESLADAPHDASRIANQQLFTSGRSGLLLGPKHPGFEEQMRLAAIQAEESGAAANEAAASEADVPVE
ncbi:MAG: DUF799 domain-containing protein [Granulosicoccus sp.]